MKVKAAIQPKSLAEFQAAMNDLALFSKEAMVDVALKQAQLICREMMMLTPPMGAGGKGGLTSTGQKAGQKSVERDIRKLYVAVDGNGTAPVYLVQQKLALAVKQGNMTEFRTVANQASMKVLSRLSPVLRKILSDYDDDRAMRKAKNYFSKAHPQTSDYGTTAVTTNFRPFHDAKLAQYGGRFKRNGKSINPLRSWTNQKLAVSEELLAEYISKRQATVGRLKSGWWDALMLIPNPKVKTGGEMEYGRAGVGPWIKAQAQGNGRVSKTDTPKTFNMTIANMIGNLNNVSDEANTKSLVLGIREANIRRDIQSRVEKMIAKANARKTK
jgi:hypothetical protein